MTQTKTPIKALVVDDHPVILEQLRIALQAEQFTVAVAADAETAWALVLADPPDAAIIDIGIPPNPHRPRDNTLGLTLARNIKLSYPSTGLVLFTQSEYHRKAFNALLAMGMTGLAYTLKSASIPDLIQTVHAVCAGHVVIDPMVKDEVNDTFTFTDMLAKLTPNECAAIEHALTVFHTLSPQEQCAAYLSASAHPAKEIAKQMGIEPRSANTHLSRVYEKLGFQQLGQPSSLKKDVLLAKTCLLHDLKNLRHA